MSTRDVLTLIQNSSIAHAISKSNHMVGASLQIVHVMGFIVLLASVVLISLRVFGLVLKQQPMSSVARDSTRLVWIGLALTFVSGTLMFIASPALYFYKWVFALKMGMLVLAVLIQATLVGRAVTAPISNPTSARASVALSIIVWFGIGMAGRMIGFVS